MNCRQPIGPTPAQAHRAAAQLVARQLARRVTSERVRVWAYHIKAMLRADA